MADVADTAGVGQQAAADRDADTGVAAPVSGWESDVAGWARRLAAATTRLAELADAHTSHVADHRRAAAVIRRPPTPRGRDDELSAAPPGGIVAATEAKASETNHPALSAAAAIDTDDLFDAVEESLDVRDAPVFPRTSWPASSASPKRPSPTRWTRSPPFARPRPGTGPSTTWPPPQWSGPPP